MVCNIVKNAQKKVSTSSIVLQVAIGPNERVPLKIHKGETANKIVNNFALQYGLDRDSQIILKKAIKGYIH